MSGENGLVTAEEFRALASLTFLEMALDTNAVMRDRQLLQMIGLRKKGFVRELSERPPADIPIYTPKLADGRKHISAAPYYLVLTVGAEYVTKHWDLIPNDLLWGVQRPVG